MSTAFIALGSNLQNPRANIAAAIAAIAALPSTSALRQAPLRTTAPVGGPPNQPDYLNTAIEIQTTLPPQSLMSALLDIERSLGRDRTSNPPPPRHGPRLIDLDLILFDDLILTTDTLTLPHPRMHQRLFVLDPLCDLAPNLRHPVLQKTLRQLQKLQDRKHRQAEFIKSLLEKSEIVEALSWLRSSPPKSPRNLGLLTARESVALVENLYKLGATEVIAVEIDDYDDGQNSGKLVLKLSDDPTMRKQVLDWSNHQGAELGFDPDEDFGQSHLFVMLD